MTAALRHLIVPALLLPSFAPAQPTLTENVFIVCIDGLRNHDGFDAGDRTMPFFQDSLRPLGSMYAAFMNNGITVTNSGHSTIVTGVRQMLPNNAGIATPVRPQEPTLAEYYRKEKGIPGEKVYYISGKSSIWRYPTSLFPGYGYPYGGTVTLTSSQDTLTWDSTRAIIQRDHPSLAYVLFAQVDAEGHTADSVKYFGAIRRVDSLVYLLWQTIQADSLYRDRTTMIVTSDHGRHDDIHGGWQGHGDYCHGCRHIGLFAIGPDIRQDYVIVNSRDQIDIAPTVAYLLGFQVPLAEGSVLDEMFVTPPPVSTGNHAMIYGGRNPGSAALLPRSPSICLDSRGIHVVFSGTSAGEKEILYTRSTDGGATWTAPLAIFSRQGTEYLNPAIVSASDSVLFVAVTGSRSFVADTTSAWILEGIRSTDGGSSWGSTILIDTLTTISTKPSLAASGSRLNLSAMMGYRVWNYTSTDAGLSFAARQIHAASSTTPVCALLDTTPYVAWRHLNKDSLPCWNVLYDRKPWRTGDHPVTDNDTGSYSYLPSLASDGDSLVHLVYVQLASGPNGNDWRIQHRRSWMPGDIWEGEREIAPGRTAWAPAIRMSLSGDVHAIWADLEGGLWSIRSSISTDEGMSWEESVQRSSPQAFILDPALAMKGDTAYVVWEGWESGSPQICLAQYGVFVTRTLWTDPGWNLISLPVDPPDRSVQTLFSCSDFCYAFTYDSGRYVQVDTLLPGRGYWTKFTGAGSMAIRGRLLTGDTISINTGWNLVGGISDTVSIASVMSIPPGNIHWPPFLYTDSGYQQSTEFLPGRGHWLKADGPGLLVFPPLR
jgi:hypothetical protein